MEFLIMFLQNKEFNIMCLKVILIIFLNTRNSLVSQPCCIDNRVQEHSLRPNKKISMMNTVCGHYEKKHYAK